MNTELTVVDAVGVQHRLTITPTRLEIKILPGTSEESCAQMKKFATVLKERMMPVTQSWRGKIALREKGGIPVLATSLQTDGGKKCHHFYEPVEGLL